MIHEGLAESVFPVIIISRFSFHDRSTSYIIIITDCRSIKNNGMNNAKRAWESEMPLNRWRVGVNDDRPDYVLGNATTVWRAIILRAWGERFEIYWHFYISCGIEIGSGCKRRVENALTLLKLT